MRNKNRIAIGLMVALLSGLVAGLNAQGPEPKKESVKAAAKETEIAGPVSCAVVIEGSSAPGSHRPIVGAREHGTHALPRGARNARCFDLASSSARCTPRSVARSQ